MLNEHTRCEWIRKAISQRCDTNNTGNPVTGSLPVQTVLRSAEKMKSAGAYVCSVMGWESFTVILKRSIHPITAIDSA
jgi:biotin synthase-like enzyme